MASICISLIDEQNQTAKSSCNPINVEYFGRATALQFTWRRRLLINVLYPLILPSVVVPAVKSTTVSSRLPIGNAPAFLAEPKLPDAPAAASSDVEAQRYSYQGGHADTADLKVSRKESKPSENERANANGESQAALVRGNTAISANPAIAAAPVFTTTADIAYEPAQ